MGGIVVEQQRLQLFVIRSATPASSVRVLGEAATAHTGTRLHTFMQVVWWERRKRGHAEILFWSNGEHQQPNTSSGMMGGGSSLHRTHTPPMVLGCMLTCVCVCVVERMFSEDNEAMVWGAW